jgi:hypothetical protein
MSALLEMRAGTEQRAVIFICSLFFVEVCQLFVIFGALVSRISTGDSTILSVSSRERSNMNYTKMYLCVFS